MVTGIDKALVTRAKQTGFMKYGQPNVEIYMNNLVKAGFRDVKEEDIEVKLKDRDVIFTAIYAGVPAWNQLENF